MDILYVIGGTLLGGLLVWLIVNKKSSGGANSDIETLRRDLSESLNTRLEQNQTMMIDQMRAQFKESSRLVTDVATSLEGLKGTNKQILGVTDELKSLQNVLQNPKQRGIIGEFYLEQLLENVLAPDLFDMQHKFKDGAIVDAVVYLDKGKKLPIDSKFSIDNYNRYVEARSPEVRQKFSRLFVADLKKRVDETAKYIRPNEGTMDFAVMFIPSEAIYYDLLVNRIGKNKNASQDLMSYAFSTKKVMVVSPTSFLAYLQTIVQGLRSLTIEEKAKEMQANVLKLGRHINVYEDLMQRMGGSLGTTVNHFNNAHNELKKIDKDIVSIAGGNKKIEPLRLKRPNND